MLLSSKYASIVLNTNVTVTELQSGLHVCCQALAKSQDPSSSFTEGDSKGKKYVLCS